MILEIQLFGALRLQHRAAPIALLRRQPAALLAYLAIAERPTPRDRLTFLLWPDQPQSQARTRLRRTLSQLRQALAAHQCADVLLNGSDTVALNSAACRIDVRQFRDLATRFLLHDPGDPELGEAALRSYTGPFLDGFTMHETPEFAQWCDEQRAALEELHRRVLQHLVAAYRHCGDLQRAATTAETLLSADPLHEEVYCALMDMYVAMDHRTAALRLYERLVIVLERELGVAPLPETQALYRSLVHTAVSPQTPAPQRNQADPGLTFVGRESELAAARATINAGMHGQRVLLALEGAAGSGKTRLLQEACRGFPLPVWQWSGHFGTQAIPYSLALRTIRQAIGNHPEQALQTLSLPDIWLVEAARLLPEIRSARPELPPPPELPTEQAQARIFEALSRLMLALVEEAGGAIVWIDDLHLSDALGRAWLEDLLHRPTRAPLIPLLAYQSHPELTTFVHGLERERQGCRLVLSSLLPATVRILAAQLGVPSSIIDLLTQRIVADTDSLPLTVIELLRALPPHAARVDWQHAELPRSARLQALLLARLDSIGALAAQVLTVCALADEPLRSAEVQRAAGRSADETALALDQLAAADLVVVHTDGYSLRHAVLAEAIRAELGGARRRLLHSRLADVLAQRAQPLPARIAYHQQQAGQPERAAQTYLQAARRSWALYAATETLELIAAAWGLQPRGGLQAELLLLREEVLHHLGRRDEQVHVLEQLDTFEHIAPQVAVRRARYLYAGQQWIAAEAQIRAAEPLDLEASVLLGRILLQQHRRAEAEAVILKALQPTTIPPGERTAALMALAEIVAAGEDLFSADAYLRQAVASLPKHDTFLRTQVDHLRGRNAFLRSEYQTALTLADRALTGYRAYGLRDREAAVLSLRAMTLGRLSRFDEALPDYAAARDLYAELGHLQGSAAAAVNAAALAIRTGHLATAVELSRSAAAAFAQIDDQRGRVIAQLNQSAALLYLDRAAEAAVLARAALESSRTLDLRLQYVVALGNLGTAVLALGDAQEAGRLMEEAVALRRELDHADVCVDLAVLAIAALCSGDLSRAMQHSAAAVAALEARGDGVELPQRISFARAQILHAAGDTSGAQQALARAEDLLAMQLLRLTPAAQQVYRASYSCHRDMAAAAAGMWPQPPRIV